MVSSASENGSSAEENAYSRAEAAAAKLVNLQDPSKIETKLKKGVPGFGYSMDYRLPPASVDYLRERDVAFWESLGEGDTPWEV